ncbi:SusD/RagB family nutrient-binding outer membrane lipoprotein [Sunxiuqinia sp. sy24]|uniref:SusD/RagB family nutrient-binding outer membrane lipoprotein n=1 Tax=Sunxiuqinia sp. sy24 TaxID=3461495 RepID=UPI0040461AF1
MKTLKIFFTLVLGSTLLFSCSDFDEVNVDPKAASADQAQVEYIINNSIIGTQQNPHVAERAFILYWKTAARQHRVNGALALGQYNDGWSSDYYSSLSGWLKSASLAITAAQEKIDNGSALPYTENLMHIARIWRVYLMSEFADNFGPMPIDAFNGDNPKFVDLQEVYYHMLAELADATAQINTEEVLPASITKYDQAYGFDYNKWIKYGNSMRLRLAMRLSEVDPSKAQAEFEAAAAQQLILDAEDNFKVAEKSGWDDLTGVMSREWNSQPLSSTLNNLYIGLGGINSEDVLPAEMHEQIKPADYMGQKFSDHLTTMTNDPSAGFWFDGLHKVMDPRAYKAFSIPGDFDNSNFSFYPSWTNDAKTVVRDLVDDEDNVIKEIDATYTWNAAPLGNWGTRSAKNQVSFFAGTNPRLSQDFRGSASERIFFASWETYFLMAEAAVKGWNTPIDAKAAYENGVKASFAYWELSAFVDDYLASESYNRVGTSVNFDHTTEPTGGFTMNFVNGYTGEAGSVTFDYPDNTIYKNGQVKNDALTKIISQKYLAQLPWLPLEAWNDHRRLGLPFFENPAVDLPLTDLPELNSSNYTTNNVKFFPQRLKYPSSLENSNPEGYQQAVGFLGGADAVLTPLWWAKKQ